MIIRRSIQLGEEIKEKLTIEQHNEREKYFSVYLKNLLMHYVHTGKFRRLEVRKDEIKRGLASPTTILISENEDNRLNQALNEINRCRNDFANMVAVTELKSKGAKND